MIKNAVSFTGHRPNKFNFSDENKAQISRNLFFEITACIKYGYNLFYFGAAPGFDLMAASMIVYFKKIFKEIQLVCVLPYEDFYLSEEFDDVWRIEYKRIIEKCDNVINPSNAKEYFTSCYKDRNRYLVENCNLLICLLDGKTGGTAQTVEMARSQKISVINVL